MSMECVKWVVYDIARDGFWVAESPADAPPSQYARRMTEEEETQYNQEDHTKSVKRQTMYYLTHFWDKRKGQRNAK